MSDSLGDRMKDHERRARSFLGKGQPVIMRIDGKAFHTYTKGCERPFDPNLINAMNECAKALCKEIQGAQMAYVQSDEISILIHGYKRRKSEAWFDNQVMKMCSVAAATAAGVMTMESPKIFGECADHSAAMKRAAFDARVFPLPEFEVCNYFIWRQQDWTRNSVQMMARSLFSHKECHKKNNSQLQDMIHGAGKNWNDLDIHLKRGQCIVKETYEAPIPITSAEIRARMPGTSVTRSRWAVDNGIPIFTQDRDYIDKHLVREE